LVYSSYSTPPAARELIKQAAHLPAKLRSLIMAPHHKAAVHTSAAAAAPAAGGGAYVHPWTYMCLMLGSPTTGME